MLAGNIPHSKEGFKREQNNLQIFGAEGLPIQQKLRQTRHNNAYNIYKLPAQKNMYENKKRREQRGYNMYVKLA